MSLTHRDVLLEKCEDNILPTYSIQDQTGHGYATQVPSILERNSQGKWTSPWKTLCSHETARSTRVPGHEGDINGRPTDASCRRLISPITSHRARNFIYMSQNKPLTRKLKHPMTVTAITARFPLLEHGVTRDDDSYTSICFGGDL